MLDADAIQRINTLAATLKQRGLAATMDDAVKVAKDIVIGHNWRSDPRYNEELFYSKKNADSSTFYSQNSGISESHAGEDSQICSGTQPQDSALKIKEISLSELDEIQQDIDFGRLEGNAINESNQDLGPALCARSDTSQPTVSDSQNQKPIASDDQDNSVSNSTCDSINGSISGYISIPESDDAKISTTVNGSPVEISPEKDFSLSAKSDSEPKASSLNQYSEETISLPEDSETKDNSADLDNNQNESKHIDKPAPLRAADLSEDGFNDFIIASSSLRKSRKVSLADDAQTAKYFPPKNDSVSKDVNIDACSPDECCSCEDEDENYEVPGINDMESKKLDDGEVMFEDELSIDDKELSEGLY